MAFNWNIPEGAHIVNILPPKDLSGGASTGDIFSLGEYAHADIIITLGVTAVASTVTVKECDNFNASNSTAIAFDYYYETTAAGDTLTTRQTATSSGFATSTNDNIMYVISLNASQLTDGYPCVQLNMSDAGGTATYGAAIAVLSGARYSGQTTPTAIA